MKKLFIVLFLLPCLAYATFTIPASGTNSGTNSGDVTQAAFGSTPNAYGYSLSGQALNLQPADATHPGGVSTSDWNTFNGKVGSSRAVNTTAPLTGGGALSGDLTIAMPAATDGVNGYLSSADHTTFNAKQNTLGIAVIEEQQAHGVDGGTATTGGWNDRVLNTTVSDDIGITLSANAFTLPAGTYLITWGSPFMGTVNRGSTRILNTTDTTVQAYSINTSIMAAGVYYLSWGETGKFTIAAPKTYKLQYQVGTTVATTGLGAQSTGTNGLTNNEVYSHVKITKF